MIWGSCSTVSAKIGHDLRKLAPSKANDWVGLGWSEMLVRDRFDC
jgi:hypothetical protein